MRTWLSSLSYILTAFAAVFLLLPLFLGLLAESRYKQIVDVINTTTPLNVKMIDYQRGWFGAEATAQISLNKLELPDKQLNQLTIVAHIAHGPILMDWKRFRFVQAMLNADINLNDAQNSLLKRAHDAGPIATARVRFKLNGNTDITLDSPPLAYQDQEKSLQWQGLKIKADFSPLYNQVDSKIDFTGLDIGIKNQNIHIGKFNSLYQGKKTSSGLWAGDRALELESFSIKNENNRISSISNLNLHALIADEPKNLASISANITCDNLTINGAAYTQNKLEFEINKLNQPALVKFQQQLTFSSAILSQQTSIGLDNIIAVLNNGSEINIKQLATNTPWGRSLATMKVIFANQPENNGLLATITNSTVNTNIQFERALALHLLEKFYQAIPSKTEPNKPAEQAEKLLNEWILSEKITTSNQDHYLHLIFDYKNGTPLINNKQLILTTKP